MEQKETTDLQPSSAQEFIAEELKFSVSRKAGSRIEFEVEAFPVLLQKAQKEAVREISKEVSLPGFRKGKAPEEMVAKHYPNQVEKSWKEKVADLSFRACEKVAHIPPLNRDTKINYNLKSCSMAEGAKLSISFEVEPEVPSVNLETIELKAVKRAEVDEEKIDELIRQIQFFFATWKEITDRPVQEGDILILDVEDIETSPSYLLFEKTRFEVKEKSMAQWMFSLVLGKNSGETIEGVSTPDETLSEEEKKAFPPKKVRVHIVKIEEPTLPPLDDAFAQKVGVPTMVELRETVQKLLNRQADEHLQETLRKELNDFLLTRYAFDLPNSLIENEMMFRFKHLLNDSEFASHWKRLSEEEQNNVFSSIHEQSKKAVMLFYLCRKILKDAHIHVSLSDLPKPPQTILETLILPPPPLTHLQSPEEIKQAEAYSHLVLQKAQDYLVSHAKLI